MLFTRADRERVQRCSKALCSPVRRRVRVTGPRVSIHRRDNALTYCSWWRDHVPGLTPRTAAAALSQRYYCCHHCFFVCSQQSRGARWGDMWLLQACMLCALPVLLAAAGEPSAVHLENLLIAVGCHLHALPRPSHACIHSKNHMSLTTGPLFNFAPKMLHLRLTRRDVTLNVHA